MITIENYEEYFLLYVDNELTPEQQSMVERFVADHPQTREEFEAMLQCRLRPDPEQAFPGKDALLHYEDALLLYVDGELDGQGKTAVETLVEQHPSVAEELSRFQLTVSRPDPAIIFPDKQTLYRHEKGKRVIGMPWLRAGVAAAVLAMVALLLLPRSHKETARQVAVSKKVPAAVTLATPRTLNIVKKEETTPNQMKKEKATPTRSRSIPQKPSAPIEPMIAQTPTAVDTGSRSTVAVSTPVKQTSPPANSVAVVYIPKEQSSFATQALLKEAQTPDDAVALTTDAGGKNKLRGIFRRVTRALGKTADRDDDGQREVLISAFQVALK